MGSGFIGGAQPLKQGKWGTLGFGWVNLNLTDWYQEHTFIASYGKEIFKEGLFVGGSMKLLKREFGSDIYTQIDPLFQKNGSNTSNFSHDLGFLYRPNSKYSVGLSLRDFTQPNVGLGSEDKVPMEIRSGFGYHQRTLTFDGEFSRRDKDMNVSMGLEKWIYKVLAVRAGFTAGSRNRRELTSGLGYNGNYFALDYAFVFPLGGIANTAGSHRFSLTVKFGQIPERARWEYESEDSEVERILEEKTAQIHSMEKELENLKDTSRSGKLESTWVRQQIQKLEEKLKVQETKDLEEMKGRLFESKLETQKMKKQIEELENRIQRITRPEKPQAIVPPTAPQIIPQSVEPVEVEQAAPAAPKSYVVQDGETLQSIAVKLYNDENKWLEIFELNADRLERGGTTRPGQVLLLPQK